jgi:DNA-binding transcriptional ArsR family regulator
MAVSGGGNDRTRGFQDAVSYAVGHRIRVEILAVLHEREASAIELARSVGQPLSTITHHVGELLKAGSIRIARTEKVRSVNQHYYRVAGGAFMSDEEMEAISEEDRQEISMMVLQALTAEALAAFWNGKLTSDPRVCLLWSWFNVDGRGREEIADEQARSWERICAIRDSSDARRAETGEEVVSVLVSALGFERCRTAPGPPCGVEEQCS